SLQRLQQAHRVKFRYVPPSSRHKMKAIVMYIGAQITLRPQHPGTEDIRGRRPRPGGARADTPGHSNFARTGRRPAAPTRTASRAPSGARVVTPRVPRFGEDGRVDGLLLRPAHALDRQTEFDGRQDHGPVADVAPVAIPAAPAFGLVLEAVAVVPVLPR